MLNLALVHFDFAAICNAIGHLLQMATGVASSS